MNSPDSGFPIDILCLSEAEASEAPARFSTSGGLPTIRPCRSNARFWNRPFSRCSRNAGCSGFGRRSRPSESAPRRLHVLAASDRGRGLQVATLLFNSDCCAAGNALERSAVGLRELIRRWERLAKLLSDEGTWYGSDRLEVIRLKGLSPRVLDLYLQEDAYWIWVHCLAAQPNPKQRDIDLILREDVMPKRLQDKDVQVWRPDPDQSRQYLLDLVTGELTRLKSAEAAFRLSYEEPARAAAERSGPGPPHP